MKQIIAVIFLVFVVIIGMNYVSYLDPNNQKILDVDFDEILSNGSDTFEMNISSEISVEDIDNALFGTWSGVINYEVAIQNAPSR